jgi:hypothetical protein
MKVQSIAYISHVTQSAPTYLIICNIQHKQKLSEQFKNLFYKSEDLYKRNIPWRGELQRAFR